MEKFGKSNLIYGYINNNVIANKKNTCIINKVYFNTFDLPAQVKNKEETLMICVDHNFDKQMNDDIKKKYNVLFIDHHLVEELDNIIYTSNSKLLYDNYEQITLDLIDIINSNNYKSITILFHTDLDGIMSGIILKQMLNDIINNESDLTISKNNIHFAMIIGELGDLSYNAIPSYLTPYFKNKNDIDIYIKKLKSFSQAMSRFIKAIRETYLDYQVMPDYTADIFNQFKTLTGYDFKDIIDFVNEYIYNPIMQIDEFDTKSIIMFMNNIAQNKMVQDIVDCYNKESERFVNNYLNPNIGATELNIRFKGFENTKYKLLMVDSRFDISRSVAGKYKAEFKKLAVNKPNVSPWYFKGTDYYSTTDLYQITKGNYDCINATNIAVYNTDLKKLSLNGENSFDICNQLFDGGGHCGDENNTAIGSAILEFDSDLLDNIIIEELK